MMSRPVGAQEAIFLRPYGAHDKSVRQRTGGCARFAGLPPATFFHPSGMESEYCEASEGRVSVSSLRRYAAAVGRSG
jgi:hypothetical protein